MLCGSDGGAKATDAQACHHSQPSVALMNAQDFNQWMNEEPQSLAHFQVYFLVVPCPPLQICNSIGNCQSPMFRLIKYITWSHLQSPCFDSVT
jgi:hypothetical protein